MEIQISFDIIDLSKSLEVAVAIADYADIVEIGTLPIYKYGVYAIEEFRKKLPTKKILADSKIVDRGKDATTLFVNGGADWVTVMAGTSHVVIHETSATAHSFGKRVLLDLLDAPAIGQSALEAKALGVDALLFHQPHDEREPFAFQEKWEMVKGNSELPIHISAKIGRDNIHNILTLHPDVVVIGRTITLVENPEAEAQYFANIVKKPI